MDLVKVNDFSVAVMIKWTCPKCGKEHENHWAASPYNAVADDGLDQYCDNCEEWFELTMYETK